MAYIYAAASLVLVLDRELMGLELTTIAEYLARITSSVWMSRSWTLQEGILAQACAFQFRNIALVARLRHKRDELDWCLIPSGAGHAPRG